MVKLIESTTLRFSRNIKAKSNNNKPLNADGNFSFLLEVFIFLMPLLCEERWHFWYLVFIKSQKYLQHRKDMCTFEQI